MRIAVLSDTHLPRFGSALPIALVAAIRHAEAELVLHLGDWTTPVAVEAVAALGLPFDGVAGNNDPPELVARFDRVKTLEIDGVLIGLTHGDLGEGRTTPERARHAFAPGVPAVGTSTRGPVDVVLFGHSHIPLLEWVAAPGPTRQKQLLLNPGSPTDRRRQPQCSWALLEVVDGQVARAEIRRFDRA
jgi:uncharacterized protein